jgi:hypothetical protein
MKTTLQLAAFLLSISLVAQTNPDYLMDSIHQTHYRYNPDGSFTLQEDSKGFVYDSNDSLVIEWESPSRRYRYEYFQDTTKKILEFLDPPSSWEPFEISWLIYENGLLKREWTRTKINNDWRDTKLKEYSYNNNNQNILFETYFKDSSGVWNVGDRIERFYDLDYNLTGQLNWTLDLMTRNLTKTLRLTYTYNGSNNKISETEWHFDGADSTIYYHSDFQYDTAGNLDTIWYFDGQGDLTNLDVYDWFGPDSSIEYRINVVNGEWELFYKKKDYLSNNPYGSYPDSIHYFFFEDNGQKIKRINFEFSYFPISSSKLYFERIRKASDSPSDTFRIDFIKREWYHKKGSVGINGPVGPIGRLKIFPNPGKRGVPISLANENANEISSFEIYNQTGTVVQSGQNTAVIETTDLLKAGTYFVIAKLSNGELSAGVFVIQ